jgi:pimeloyl-ACP methyl ester carboxylesterase
LTSIIDIDVTEKLANVRVPVLYLQATRDRLVSHRVSRAILRLKPDTHIEGVDSPHLLLQTAPAIAARFLKNFVSGLTLSS